MVEHPKSQINGRVLPTTWVTTYTLGTHLQGVPARNEGRHRRGEAGGGAEGKERRRQRQRLHRFVVVVIVGRRCGGGSRRCRPEVILSLGYQGEDSPSPSSAAARAAPSVAVSDRRRRCEL